MGLIIIDPDAGGGGAIAGARIHKGAWDASAGTFPGAGAAQTGWEYRVSVAGTVGGIAFADGDDILAIADNASTTVYAANWLKGDNTDQVLSVAGKTGDVTLAQADISGLTTGDSPTFGGVTVNGNISTGSGERTISGGGWLMNIYTMFKGAGLVACPYTESELVISANSWLRFLSSSVNGFVPGGTRMSPIVDGIEIKDGSGIPKNFQLGGLRHVQITIASLPAASTLKGWRHEVNDASSPTLGATVASGGSAEVEVRSNGTNWIVTAIF